MNNPSPITVHATRRFGAAPERIKKITMGRSRRSAAERGGLTPGARRVKTLQSGKGAIEN